MSSADQAVDRRQLKDRVYLQLRAEIVSMHLAPGTPLREADLSQRFGVSKTPLREAFVRLAEDGFVEVMPYKGAVVAGYDREDLREIYELRELLEGACARQAAVSMLEQDLARLNQVVRRSNTAAAGHDEQALPELFDEFDSIIYSQVRNRRISDMIERIRDHVTRIGGLTVSIPGRLDASVRQHEEIYEAIVRRDGVLAETLMRGHILSVMADLLASLDE